MELVELAEDGTGLELGRGLSVDRFGGACGVVIGPSNNPSWSEIDICEL